MDFNKPRKLDEDQQPWLKFTRHFRCTTSITMISMKGGARYALLQGARGRSYQRGNPRMLEVTTPVLPSGTRLLTPRPHSRPSLPLTERWRGPPSPSGSRWSPSRAAACWTRLCARAGRSGWWKTFCGEKTRQRTRTTSSVLVFRVVSGCHGDERVVLRLGFVGNFGISWAVCWAC